MRSLFKELRRRRVFRVAGIYIIASWVITQAADILMPALHLPEWFTTLVVALLILGFPIAMVLAWAFDVGPEGISRTDRQSTSDEKRVKAMLIYGMLLALGTGFLLLLLYPGEFDRKTEAPAQAELPPGTETRKSIAVLPFVNMSADPDNEYFSDGVSEELINALAKVQGIKVAARTSAFQFKGDNRNIKEIGETLDVNTILEGSVRKAGNQVRITAQLINVEDGYHIWSDTYDRELENIFTLQDEIATAIVGALAAVLDGEFVQPMASNAPTKDIEAYQLYLRGRHLWRQRNPQALHQSIELFKQAIELDPGFARAHSNLADAYATIPGYDFNIDPDVYYSLAESFALAALKIDAQSGEARAALGLVLGHQKRWLEAARVLRAAVEFRPDDPNVRHRYAAYFLNTGHTERGLAEIQRAYELDPLNSAIASWYSTALLQAGRNEEALKFSDIAKDLGTGVYALVFQAFANKRLGNHDVAEQSMIKFFATIGYPVDWIPLYLQAIQDK
ncbi:MAG: FlgO family outer membrane protein, partial [Gammaproteobacteria bacterium]|nr:FlgO family outer membrane protein [Gammaproteobacteria bacterium]